MKKPTRKRNMKARTAISSKPADGEKLRVLFSEAQIRRRVREMAGQLNREFKGKTLHVVAVLENAFVFTSDLIRKLKVPVYCSFVRADIRDSSPRGIATREITYTPPVQAAGQDILLVEGILQSGMTMDHLYRYLLGQNPSSIRTASLVEKIDERKVDVPTDYVGFKAKGKYLVGYGLGYQGRYKNLACIATLG
jgi:hypoxanthine phosphoribosyltransferase